MIISWLFDVLLLLLIWFHSKNLLILWASPLKTIITMTLSSLWNAILKIYLTSFKIPPFHCKLFSTQILLAYLKGDQLCHGSQTNRKKERFLQYSQLLFLVSIRQFYRNQDSNVSSESQRCLKRYFYCLGKRLGGFIALNAKFYVWILEEVAKIWNRAKYIKDNVIIDWIIRFRHGSKLKPILFISVFLPPNKQDNSK